MKNKKYKVRWNRILCAVLIPIVLIFLIYFGFIKDYEKEHLLKIGYNEQEIYSLREELSSEEIKKLYDYSYLSFLVELTTTEEYKSENMLSYIDYILKIEDNYILKDIVYIVNNGIKYDYTEKLSKLINEEYFVLSRLDRYMSYKSDDTSVIVAEVNSNLDYEYYTNTNKTDTSKETLLLVNKYYYLEKDYYYGELVTMDSAYDNKNGSKLNSVAYEAFKKLVDDAEKEGYHIRNNSAYRSYETQSNLYNQYKKNGTDYADKWSARAGHSEHQTGLALDVGVQTKYSNSKFENSKEFTWMKENSYKYGFILRYPKDKTHITGYGYEPWHYRYVGVEVATYIYEHDITFEEYYAYFVEKN